MALSYSLSKKPLPWRIVDGKINVLITGAAGDIGSYFAAHANSQWRLRLMVRQGDDVGPIKHYGEVVTANLADLPAMKRICQDIDTIVHLAGDPVPDATWSSVRTNNIEGTYNLFVAAKSANVRRVVYASSIHAVSGYARDLQVKTSEAVNPGDLYGVGKCFCEALARYMAEQEGISSICVRIGSFQPDSNVKRRRSIAVVDSYVSQRDLLQLFERCVADERLQFAIFNGISNNSFKRLDISDARELVGYEPQDDLANFNPQLKALNLPEAISSHNVIDDGQESGLRNELR